MAKTKVSPRQLMILTSGFSFGSVPLMIPSRIADLAGPDVWISILLGAVAGLPVIWIYAKLGELNPDKTFAEILRLYLGKWAGGLVALFYILSGLVLTTQISWYMGDFVRNEFRSDLPIIRINIFFVVLLAFAMWCGVEAMYRATELLYYILFSFFIVTVLLLIPSFKPEYLLPIMENGPVPVLKGSIPFITDCVLPLVFLNMVYPVCLENVQEAKKALFKGYLIGALTTLIAVTTCVLVMGSSLIANVRSPMYTVNKEISHLVVFSRIEAATVAISLGVSFIAAFSYAYAGVLALAQLIKVKNYKYLIPPIGLLIILYSPDIYYNTVHEIQWDSLTWPPLSFTLGFIIPGVVLTIAVIKKRKENNQQSGNQAK